MLVNILDPEIIEKLKKIKKETGMSYQFFVTRALEMAIKEREGGKHGA